MKIIENQTFDQERAFYGSRDVTVKSCAFRGPADGESAFKECQNIGAENTLFDLRYPFWHDNTVRLNSCELTEHCRAAFWYSTNIKIEASKLHGIKALRECADIVIRNTDVQSPEFGWFVHNLHMENCTAEGEYFMMRSDRLQFKNVKLTGKYSFQYVKDSTFESCQFDTKDSFWHAKNVTVKNSVIKGEYLAWYAENITFENCKIIGTQPFCYCKNLTLINCEMLEADLCFEKSEVTATLTAPVISIKNPTAGSITLPYADEMIMDDPQAKCKINFTQKKMEAR